MSLAQDIADAEGEAIAFAGETITWRPIDGATSYALAMKVQGNTATVLKSAVTAVSPNRFPQNGDTLTSAGGDAVEIESVNAAFDQVMDGGFSVKPTLRAGGMQFYRLICRGAI